MPIESRLIDLWQATAGAPPFLCHFGHHKHPEDRVTGSRLVRQPLNFGSEPVCADPERERDALNGRCVVLAAEAGVAGAWFVAATRLQHLAGLSSASRIL